VRRQFIVARRSCYIAFVASPELDFERSLALHVAVAQRLHQQPEIVDRAKHKLSEWLARGGRSEVLWRKWEEILKRSPDEIAAVLSDRSEEAAWLRKASPFAGVLSPRERIEILRETRRRLESAP
jgi:hypothetical protein